MTGLAATARVETYDGTAARRRKRLRRAGLHAFLIAVALIWLAPLAWAVYTSLRPYEETTRLGYVSFGGEYNFDNYIDSWTKGEIAKYFINTAIIVVPAVVLVLLLASMMAFAVSRYSWRFNLFLLMVFTAANLLPPQVIITPLFRMFLVLPLPSSLSDNDVLLRPVLRDHGRSTSRSSSASARSSSATT